MSRGRSEEGEAARGIGEAAMTAPGQGRRRRGRATQDGRRWRSGEVGVDKMDALAIRGELTTKAFDHRGVEVGFRPDARPGAGLQDGPGIAPAPSVPSK